MKEFLKTRNAKNGNLEVFFLIVIFARWSLPKGKITLEELSKLLLIYMSVIADILDMMKMARNIKTSTCSYGLKKRLFDLSLVSLSVCILQLCLGLTVKRRSRRSIKITNSSSKLIKSISIDSRPCLASCLSNTQKIFIRIFNRLSELFEKEVWGIMLLLLVKDVPFSILRTYALIAPPKNCELWNQSIFFTLKNYVTIIIQLNRCYVLGNRLDSGDNRSETSQHETNNDNSKNNGKNRTSENKTFYFIQQDSTQPLSTSSSFTTTSPPSSSSTSKDNNRNSSIFKLFKKNNKINNEILTKTSNNKANLNSITEISDSSYTNNNFYL
jgi:hypothetical protein